MCQSGPYGSPLQVRPCRATVSDSRRRSPAVNCCVEVVRRVALEIVQAVWRCSADVRRAADEPGAAGDAQVRGAWSIQCASPGACPTPAQRLLASSLACELVQQGLWSRFGQTLETPSSAQVAEHFLLRLCGRLRQTRLSTGSEHARPGLGLGHHLRNVPIPAQGHWMPAPSSQRPPSPAQPSLASSLGRQSG